MTKLTNEEWIYLDYNASSPQAASVSETMSAAWQASAHPSSAHPQGRQAAALIEEARHAVAKALGSKVNEVVFCSGSTEASNHVIKGVAFSRLDEGPLHFISSTVEHAATLVPLTFLQKLGHQVTLVPVDRYGRIDPDTIREALQDNTVLVTLIHGQNEVGTVQPIAEVGALLAEREVLFHVDASQSFGKVPVDVEQLKADFLNIAGHKIYGPKGIGALYIREGVTLEPLLHGGGHENGFRSGTPAPPLIAGLGEACRLVAQQGLVPAEPSDRLWELISSQLGDEVRRNGHPFLRLPNVVHLTFKGGNGREILNRAKISASTGAACHSARVSPVLEALGFTPEEARASVRLSTGRSTDLDTVERAANALVQAYRSAPG